MIGDVKWEFETQNDDLKKGLLEMSLLANIPNYDQTAKEFIKTEHLRLGSNTNSKGHIFVWVKNIKNRTVAKLGTHTDGKTYWWKEYEPMVAGKTLTEEE